MDVPALEGAVTFQGIVIQLKWGLKIFDVLL